MHLLDLQHFHLLHLLAQRAHFLTAQLGDIVALEDDFAAGSGDVGDARAMMTVLPEEQAAKQISEGRDH